MYNLNNDEKLDFIIKTSKKLGVTSNDYGENTKLSTMGAHNILTGESKNPRTKNLNIMLEYLEKLQTGKNFNKPVLKEPEEQYDSIDNILFNKIYNKFQYKFEEIDKRLTTLESKI